MEFVVKSGKVLVSLMIAGVILLLASCDTTGENAYENINVPVLSASDVDGDFEGDAVDGSEDFEDSLLAPLFKGLLSGELEESQFLVLSMDSPASPDARVMETFVDENKQVNEKINLFDGGLFSAGVLHVNGYYNALGKSDNDALDISLDLDADLAAVLTEDAVLETDDGELTISGKANAEALADFNLKGSGTEPNMAVRLDVDYGVAFSAAMLLSYAPDDESTPVGALVVLNMHFSGSGHKTYYQKDYPAGNEGMEAVIMDMLDDSLPADASLDVAVYDNDRNLIFQKSYGYMDLVATFR